MSTDFCNKIETPSLSSLFDDISYTFSDVPKNIEKCKVNKVLIQANEHECLIKIPSIADYYINQDGITVDAKTNDKNRFHQISTFADIYALPAYIYLKTKKDLLIGASAVKKRDGKAVLFCGASSSGKSTLAWELCSQGATFISDEYVNIFERDGKVFAQGYHPYLMLSTSALTLTNTNLDELSTVYPNSHRYIVYPHNRCTQPCEVDSIINLTASNTDFIEVDKVIGENKLTAIIQSLYLYELAYAFIPLTTRFSEIVRIINQVDILEINYNKEAAKLENTVQSILSAVEKAKQ